MRALLPCLMLLACTPDDDAPFCADGIDIDGDGVCDRETADWSAEARVEPGSHRGNIYNLPEDRLREVQNAGYQHTYVWPVDVSGLLLPYRPLEAFFSEEAASGGGLASAARNVFGFGTLPEMYDWLGLAPFPPPDAEGIYALQPPPGMSPGDPAGVGVISRPEGDALTFSCATCHTAELFGKTVMGLTNRRARANEFFHLATRFFPGIDPDLFASITNATDGELDLFERTQRNLPAAGAKPPEALGLDTSLAQVALSLSRREPDAWATRSPTYERDPRPNALQSFVADSKPAVWWTMKYKTRWLSDASIRTGNPVFTNFLWNELGRATDLHELEAWLRDNGEVIDELTVAVFATEAPRWVDFFGEDSLDLPAAQRGEALFNDHCASCHGTYEKDWSSSDPSRTTRVVYHERTPVYDVGTDPQRAEGMQHFFDGLNRLAISEWMDTLVEVQPGYVPPPLDGIWARYPYLHNHSVPTLCHLLSPEDERPESFWMGPSNDPATDFTADCVGYPTGDAIPEPWKEVPDAFFDTTTPGLSNQGHTDFLTDASGDWVLDEGDRVDLIAFLKTL